MYGKEIAMNYYNFPTVVVRRSVPGIRQCTL